MQKKTAIQICSLIENESSAINIIGEQSTQNRRITVLMPEVEYQN